MSELENMWYLRGGDFKVEKLTRDDISRLFGKLFPIERAIQQLEQDNNLFHSKVVAEIASERIRKYLGSLSRSYNEEHQESNRQTQMPSHNSEQRFQTDEIQTPDKEIQNLFYGLQKPNAKTVVYHADNNRSHEKEILITIRIQS